MELISRASLVEKLTSADMQKKFREMTGQEAYYLFLEMVNGLPAEKKTNVHQYGENCSSITNTGTLNISL